MLRVFFWSRSGSECQSQAARNPRPYSLNPTPRTLNPEHLKPELGTRLRGLLGFRA